ncbi:MAG: hypothetical protein KAH18_07565 [Psychromonas sp.]|nr:hypothetical protein [Psychromonas sp.]
MFHPWEGGEGVITGQFIINKLCYAINLMKMKNFPEAIKQLLSALNYPFNLGEGRLFQQTDNDIHYYLGVCYEQEKQHKISLHHFKKATQGAHEIGQSRYYND